MSQLSGQTSVAHAALLVAVCSGCGADPYATAPVTGHVTCNGKPALGGYIVFEPIDTPDKTGRPAGNPGRISRGMVQQDGSFTLTMDPRGADDATEGAHIGPHRIMFVPPLTEPVKMHPSDSYLPAEEQERIKSELAAIPIFLPLECGPEGISPSEVEVQPGKNSFAFELKPSSKPRATRAREQPFGSS